MLVRLTTLPQEGLRIDLMAYVFQGPWWAEVMSGTSVTMRYKQGAFFRVVVGQLWGFCGVLTGYLPGWSYGSHREEVGMSMGQARCTTSNGHLMEKRGLFLFASGLRTSGGNFSAAMGYSTRFC